jgi:hypothetical protein
MSDSGKSSIQENSKSTIKTNSDETETGKSATFSNPICSEIQKKSQESIEEIKNTEISNKLPSSFSSSRKRVFKS